MNAFEISVRRLAGAAPDALVIRAPELAVRFEADAIIAQAHREAQVLLDRADAAMAQALAQAEAIRTEAREQGLAQAATERELARAALVDETVEWLVAEAQLEAEIARQLEARIRALVATALEAFAGTSDATELLMTRVAKAVSKRSTEGAIKVYVREDALAAATAACAQYPHVRVIANAGLERTQAVLETPLVRVRIDLAQHLQSVLARLCDVTDQERVDGRADQ